MRTSSLIAVLVLGWLMLSGVSLAKPILDFRHESVFQSQFCRLQVCRFINSSFDRSDRIVEQYLYQLKNGLYFAAARFPSLDKNVSRYDQVNSVSIMARATPKNLKKLESYLPEFIGETAFGHRIDFQYNFKQKCARVAQNSYEGGGLFEQMVIGQRTLTIACKPQAFNMLTVTLYWGKTRDWIEHSFGFNCSAPDQAGLPTCPWFSSTIPRRIF
jgi:hypothetical protein